MSQRLQKKLFLIQLMFISIIFILVNFSTVSFAQGDKQATVEEKAFESNTEEARTSQGEEKHSAAYDILGRELTSKEKDEYGDYGEAIKAGLLSTEQRLVVVRVLIEEGESASATKILAIWPMSKLQTFTELVQIFDDYKEKYGSVKEGIESELVFNIKDDEQAYKKAAQKAYETVFCVLPENDEDVTQIINYLKENKAFTYSQMVKKLMDTLTQDDKKDMLFKALDKVGRSDLKSNKTFINKMLAQQFNCEDLTALLQEITPKNKPPSKPTKKPVNNKKK